MPWSFPPPARLSTSIRANSPAPDWALPWLEAEAPPEVVVAPDGQELFRVYRLSGPPMLPAADEMSAATPSSFGGLIRLDALTAEPAAAGQTLSLTLRWTVTAALPGVNYATFVHREDMNGHRWSQTDQDGYPAEQWTPGEVILERIDLSAPPGMPPSLPQANGLYRLRLGRFDPPTGDRLPLMDDAATFAGDALLSDDVVILHGPPPDPLPLPPFPVGQTVAEGLTLLGYERGARAVETGEVVALALWWLAAVPQPFRQLRLSLAGPDGAARTVVQGQPAYNTYPFDRWQTPAFVIDRQLFAVPDDLPGGDYTYRLELLDAQGRPIYAADLGLLTVTQT